ncbi:XRE family transcriptional regulator [Caballeronia sordidicola]|uniref:HTH cro/C1-type domain-containing protein n=1 Tax=Caballeronia sordidicola TaxID=196367 RepID=A0A242N4B7_CABSO|nr:XRE family transcriptional regulator [Caballeronia sordidicola]OTP78499.1 hypothetical protein PAMC26577_04870 [Caballeronia sordidicola]
MCALTGINRKTQFAYEKDQRYPDAGYLLKLVDANFDVQYILTGQRPPRFSALSQELLQEVLMRVDQELQAAAKVLDATTKAKLAALVYHGAAKSGRVDTDLIAKAIALIS